MPMKMLSEARQVHLHGWNLRIERADEPEDVHVTMANGTTLHLPRETRRALFRRTFAPQ
ncbi:hypothetical protein GCM10025874_03080 [Arenivirga flava]|uniref:Uncharacterized protein n=1 Tax=Arenivirga flava TaxID=1930060 RepID=A0AA37UB23_9MICO|nr:hypothetical protein GCM10025874_03080 [Arenivirga flava]